MRTLFLACLVTVATLAHADEPKPARLPHEAMLALENDGLKLRLMQRQVEDLQRSAKEINEHRAATLKKYGVSLDDVSAGKVKIAEDGTVTRSDAKPKK